MFAKGSPELNFETLKKAFLLENKIQLRGDDEDKVESLTKQGTEYERKGEIDKALSTYEKAVSLL